MSNHYDPRDEGGYVGVADRRRLPLTGTRIPALLTTTNPLPGLSADVLLKRAIATARDRNARKGAWHPRWVAVMDTFALGSTYAANLCLWAGLNPDEDVKR